MWSRGDLVSVDSREAGTRVGSYSEEMDTEKITWSGESTIQCSDVMFTSVTPINSKKVGERR